MTRPTVGEATENAYARLPLFVRGDDEGLDYPLLAWLSGALDQADSSAEILRISDPDQSVSGTVELTNPAYAPRLWLGWLGWLVGIDTSVIADAYDRDAVVNAARTQRRGSIGAIVDAAQRTLTGSRSCRVYHNLSGTEPYLITVITSTDQTPDLAATLAAILTEKPAGCDLDFYTVDAAAYADIDAGFADYAAVAAALSTYDDVLSYVP